MDSKHVTDKAYSLIKLLHSCPIGAKEFSGGFCPERVDAILFKTGVSFMIETKISRSDFLADRKKLFRSNPALGVGTYRYYACPTGLISPEELPKKWGLIYVNEGNTRASMPVGFGDRVKTGETKHPVYGWTVPIFERYGSECPPDIRALPNSYKHPEYPANKFRFEVNYELENRYLFALCTRYKSGKFLKNID